jgi:hypothetical protein
VNRGIKSIVVLPIHWLCLALVLALLPVAGFASDERERLQTRAARENNPVRKARFLVQIAERDFQQASELYSKGYPEKGLEHLQMMLAVLEDTNEVLFSSGRDPRRRPRGFKDTEIKLRELGRRTEDLRVTLPVDERGDVEKITDRLREIQDDLLHGIMRTKRPGS